MKKLITVITTILLASCVRYSKHDDSNTVDKYGIVGHDCECTLISYNGSFTKLLCTDTTGHMFEIEVLNHQVVEM